MASNPTVFFDVSAGGQPLGRIEMVSIDTVYFHTYLLLGTAAASQCCTLMTKLPPTSCCPCLDQLILAFRSPFVQELRADVVPKTAENFRALCTGKPACLTLL